MSKFKNWTRERIRENQRDIRENTQAIQDLELQLASYDGFGARLVELEEKVTALEEMIKSGPNGELPAGVYDLVTLKAYIDIRFFDEVRQYRDISLKEICMQVRDALAETYENIERVNDQQEHHNYSAPDEKHADAVYLVIEDQIVDFCGGSTEPGRLIDRLIWSIATETPW